MLEKKLGMLMTNLRFQFLMKPWSSATTNKDSTSSSKGQRWDIYPLTVLTMIKNIEVLKVKSGQFSSDNARQSTIGQLHESDCHQDWIYDHKGKGELTHFKLTATLRRKIIFMVLLTVFSGRTSPRHSFPSSTRLCLLLRLFEERQVCMYYCDLAESHNFFG